MAGVVKRHGVQFQAPYSAYDALNVRCDSVASGNLEGRERGGSRPGLDKFFSQQLGTSGNRKVQMMNTVTWVASDTINSRFVAISNGDLYYENPVGTLGLAGTSGGTFHTTRMIHSAERNQVLYIADHSYVVSESAAANVPKKWTPSTDTIASWTATDGTIPYGCDNIALWRDRMVLGGGTTTPHGLFMSRQGDPDDWDYSETDSGAAVSLTLADAGQVGDIVTALSPHSDNCLLIGCASSLWIMRGDPNFGGSLDCLSQHLGVIDKGAWCTTPESLFVFLTQDGLYMVPAGCDLSRYPQSLSRERLPRELLGTDKSTYTVAMAYDLLDRGIHVYKTPTTAIGTPSSHWFFDWETKSFWPVKHATEDQEPFCLHARKNYYTGSEGSSIVAMGCRDGYVRYHRQIAENDDGTAFDSWVLLGPFGDPTLSSDVSLDQILGILAHDSGSVTYTLHVGDSPEEAVAAGHIYSGTWTAGRNNLDHPRVRGQSVYVKLSAGQPGLAWAWESGYIVLQKRGMTRI